MGVVVVRVRPERLGEDLGHVHPGLVDRRRDDVARLLVVELLDPLAEVGLDHLDPVRRHVVAEAALLGEHRLRLHQRLGAVAPQDLQDDPVVVGPVLGPVDMDAVGFRGCSNCSR